MRWNMNSATPPSRVPVPAMNRGSIRLSSFDARVAPKTMPKQNGRKANPAFSGE